MAVAQLGPGTSVVSSVASSWPRAKLSEVTLADASPNQRFKSTTTPQALCPLRAHAVHGCGLT